MVLIAGACSQAAGSSPTVTLSSDTSPSPTSEPMSPIVFWDEMAMVGVGFGDMQLVVHRLGRCFSASIGNSGTGSTSRNSAKSRGIASFTWNKTLHAEHWAHASGSVPLGTNRSWLHRGQSATDAMRKSPLGGRKRGDSRPTETLRCGNYKLFQSTIVGAGEQRGSVNVVGTLRVP